MESTIETPMNNTLFEEYLTLYNKYMDSLNETIQDVHRDMYDINCPTWIRKQFVNSYDMLKQKKQDYEDMHNDIIKEPSKFENAMKQFITNYKN